MDQIIDELKSDCDYLLVDSPHMMAAADSAILAAKVDGLIMVVTTGETRADTFHDAVDQIQRSGTPLVGYVVNKVRSGGMGYGRYRYQYYDYYRREEDREPDAVGGNGSGPE